MDQKTAPLLHLPMHNHQHESCTRNGLLRRKPRYSEVPGARPHKTVLIGAHPFGPVLRNQHHAI